MMTSFQVKVVFWFSVIMVYVKIGTNIIVKFWSIKLCSHEALFCSDKAGGKTWYSNTIGLFLIVYIVNALCSGY